MNVTLPGCFRKRIEILLTAALFWGGLCFCAEAQVIFVHDIQSRELFMGEQEEEQWTAYTSEEMLIDRKTRYTGSWMKRIFGKVKEHQRTTLVRLEPGEIREADYERNRVIVYPLNRIADPDWVDQKIGMDEQAQAIVEERYRVLEPQLDIMPLEAAETVAGYPCRLVESTLRQETVDVKKNASSVTLIHQKLWLTDHVHGYDVHVRFHDRLAAALGLDAERLGNLAFLLRYWKGSLDPVREKLAETRGFPVKSEVTVEAHYITETDSLQPRTIIRQIKAETKQLREIRQGDDVLDFFKSFPDFAEIVVR